MSSTSIFTPYMRLPFGIGHCSGTSFLLKEPTVRFLCEFQRVDKHKEAFARVSFFQNKNRWQHASFDRMQREVFSDLF